LGVTNSDLYSGGMSSIFGRDTDHLDWDSSQFSSVSPT